MFRYPPCGKGIKVGLPLYSVKGLVQVYRNQPVLRIDRIEITAGSIVGVIGPNGSGKSTFLKLVGFIDKPTAGEIFYNGKPAAPFAPEVRHKVSLMPQEPFLMKRTVSNNVAYGLKIRKDLDRLAQRIQTALSWVGLDASEFSKRPSYALSGGEAQRVALAARLILKPEVLLLDEPTASIDALSAQLIKDAALKARNMWGTTLVIASHDWQWLYGVCDRIVHLVRGRLMGTGRENIIFGPWQAGENGLWEKVLSDGQRVLVQKPPEALSAAVIDDVAVFSTDRSPASGENQVKLSGLITRLALEKASGDIVGSVLVANVPFTTTLAEKQVVESGLYPGRRVHLLYDVRSVRWF
jgi:tungstate transport system ATP-binding protein